MSVLFERDYRYPGVLNVEDRSAIIFNAIWREIEDDICKGTTKPKEIYDKYVYALAVQIFHKSIVWGMKEHDFFEHLEIIANSSYCENIACYTRFVSGIKCIALKIEREEDIDRMDIYENLKDYADALAMFEITGYGVNTWHKNRYGMTLSEKMSNERIEEEKSYESFKKNRDSCNDTISDTFSDFLVVQ